MSAENILNIFNRVVNTHLFSNGTILGKLILISMLVSCNSDKRQQKEEQISIRNAESSNVPDSLLNSIKGNVSFNQIATYPNSVILTGLADHRLVTVYKLREEDNSKRNSYNYSGYSNNDGDESGQEEHFMPGIDILYGYNLLNIAHYDLKSERLNFLFNHPALIKTLYYPCFIQDSLDKKPINRDYYLVSVYDEDTNKDTLINKKDLRRFYLFNAGCSVKTRIIPGDYSAIHSQYDSQNDVMYIFARQDTDKNGVVDNKEPLHVFWISLKTPLEAKRLY